MGPVPNAESWAILATAEVSPEADPRWGHAGLVYAAPSEEGG